MIMMIYVLEVLLIISVFLNLFQYFTVYKHQQLLIEHYKRLYQECMKLFFDGLPK